MIIFAKSFIKECKKEWRKSKETKNTRNNIDDNDCWRNKTEKNKASSCCASHRARRLKSEDDEHKKSIWNIFRVAFTAFNIITLWTKRIKVGSWDVHNAMMTTTSLKLKCNSSQNGGKIISVGFAVRQTEIHGRPAHRIRWSPLRFTATARTPCEHVGSKCNMHFMWHFALVTNLPSLFSPLQMRHCLFNELFHFEHRDFS